MPTYTYICESCGYRKTEIRSMSQRQNCPDCDKCGGPTGLRLTSLEWRRGPQWKAKMVHGHDAGKPGTKMDDPR